MAGELLHAHDQFKKGATPDLAPPQRSHREIVAAEVTRDDRWWRGYLADLDPVTPTRDAQQLTTIHLAPAQWRAVVEHCQANAITPFVGVLTHLFAALQEVMGSEDVVVGTALAGMTKGRLKLADTPARPHERIPSLEAYYRGRISPDEIEAVRKECTTKGEPLHDALMTRAGWPEIPLDGKLLVSQQDALLMGGKVQSAEADSIGRPTS